MSRMRFASAGLRDGGPACTSDADWTEALAGDDGELVVPEDVCAALTYFSPSSLDCLRRFRARRCCARRRSTPVTILASCWFLKLRALAVANLRP